PLGESFPLLLQVKNIGLAPTRATARLKYNLIPIDPRTDNPDPLAPKKDLKGPTTATVPILNGNTPFNDTEMLTIQLNTPLGEYFLEACVDSEKVVPESNELDNCRLATGTITVTGLPDYVVTNLTVKCPSSVNCQGDSPIQVKRNTGSIVGATVKNQGIGDALRTSLLKFNLVSIGPTPPIGVVKNLNGTPIPPALAVTKTVTFSNLPVGVFLDTQLGSYHLQACADGTDLLRESATGPQGTAETNNCMTINNVIQVIP